MRTIFLTVLVAALGAMSAQTAFAQRSTGERQAAPVAAEPTLRAAPAPRAALGDWEGAEILIVDESGRLGFVNIGTGGVEILEPPGTPFTDLAFCPPRSPTAPAELWAITFNRLFRIERAPIEEVPIGNGFNSIGLNALVCDQRGRLWAHSDQTERGLFKLDKATGEPRRVGGPGARLLSDGDLVFHEDELLVSTTNRNLVALDRATGLVLRDPVSVGLDDLYGLVSIGPSQLIGCAETKVYHIKPNTGRPTELFDYAGSGLGSCQGATYNGNFRLSPAN